MSPKKTFVVQLSIVAANKLDRYPAVCTQLAPITVATPWTPDAHCARIFTSYCNRRYNYHAWRRLPYRPTDRYLALFLPLTPDGAKKVDIHSNIRASERAGGGPVSIAHGDRARWCAASAQGAPNYSRQMAYKGRSVI